MTRILKVVTRHGMIEGERVVWFSEFSEPYEALLASGAEINVASRRSLCDPGAS
jgi:hypothetical protein